MCVLRDRRNTLEACLTSRVGFSRQAQHFVLPHRCFSWQARHFVTWRGCCFHDIAVSGPRKHDTVPKVVFVSALKSGGSFAKQMLFELCANSLKRKTRRKSSSFRFRVSRLEDVSHEMLVLALQALKLGGHSSQNWRKSRAKCAGVMH